MDAGTDSAAHRERRPILGRPDRQPRCQRLGGLRPGITPHHALKSVGLDGYEDVPLRQLSAGQKKRVALARLLLVPAALWLLDEPYANLDREGMALVNRLLEVHALRGGAALITSHGAYAYTSGTPRRLQLHAPAEKAA